MIKTLLCCLLLSMHWPSDWFKLWIPSEPEPETIKARITYYCPGPIWGKQVADPDTNTAIKGVTVAAHPDFNFGTEIYIPKLDGVLGNGNFVVQDRGPAVTKKKASRGKAYVFDVFVNNRSEINKYMKYGDYMEVEIKE